MMSKLRNVVGLIASVFLALSSGAHSFLGWKSLHERLTQANAPPDLTFGLGVGWQFGGVAMLAFAIIAINVFVKRMRGQSISPFPVAVIGGAYLLFGLVAYSISDFDPFFIFMFIIPAVLLLVGISGKPASSPAC
jgi:hypothetical protein